MIKSVTNPRMKLMKNTHTLLAKLFLAAALFAASGQIFHASSQNATTAKQQLKEKWSKALTDARQDLLNRNDRESAEFATAILGSLERPDGMSPSASAGDSARIRSKVRELVRRGALESAGTLNEALLQVLNQPGPGTEPAHPNNKLGGTPGPGGLVLYLPFDTKDEGGIIHDASGAGNDGHVFGAQWVPEGRFGGAYHFSITNLDDRIVIPNSDLLNPDYLTISAWIKTSDTDGFWNRIVDKDGRTGYCLCLGGGGKDLMQLRGKLTVQTGESNTPLFSLSTVGDNRWHHIAVTYDGKMLGCFVDGQEQRPPLNTPGPLAKNKWDLCIGNSVVDRGTGEFLAYDGLIDEVRIYNRALSVAEIKALETATQAGIKIASAPKPVALESGTKPSAAERLKKVKALYDQGLINKDDYDKKVKEIMDSL